MKVCFEKQKILSGDVSSGSSPYDTKTINVLYTIKDKMIEFLIEYDYVKARVFSDLSDNRVGTRMNMYAVFSVSEKINVDADAFTKNVFAKFSKLMFNEINTNLPENTIPVTEKEADTLPSRFQVVEALPPDDSPYHTFGDPKCEVVV